MPTSSSFQNQQDQHLRAQLELLQNHDAGLPSAAAANTRATSSTPSPYSPYRASNGVLLAGYQDSRATSSKSEVEAHIHPDLRAPATNAPAANMMPIAPPSGHSPGSAGPSTAQIAPVPQIPGDPGADFDDGGDLGRSSKAKRELSQSKRAAQNRAAQRAFRLRKESYIHKLEQQVREYMDMESSFKQMQTENYALREYVLHLQARLLDAQGDVPQPPPNVNLSQPPVPPTGAISQQTGSSNPEVPLEAVAQAVAGLAAHEQMSERQDHYPSPTGIKVDPAEDTRTAEEINRQLQPEDGVGQMPAV